MSQTEIQRLYTYICLELKHYRINISKLKQEEVAFDLDMTPGYLSRIENGKISKLSLYHLLRLSDYYNVAFVDIVQSATEKLRLDNLNYWIFYSSGK
jgi:transcriptional regulator with XRE-family HTH domain